MDISKILIRGLRYIIKGTPTVNVTANIVSLAPNQLLKGRKALITGGTSGIGYEIAKSFVNSGASVVITGRNNQKTSDAVIRLKDTTGQVGHIFGLKMNNIDISSFDYCISEAKTLMGGVDILVNNAGILGGDICNVTEMEYTQIMDTNLKGGFFLSRKLGLYWKENRIKGNILNICSSSSLRPAASAYTLTKWGLRGLTLGLAKSFAPYGITVNGLAPGPTATKMILAEGNENIAFKNNPIGRCAMPEEIANMAVFLVSDMGRTIVGDIIYMTGGAGLITLDDVNYNF